MPRTTWIWTLALAGTLGSSTGCSDDGGGGSGGEESSTGGTGDSVSATVGQSTTTAGTSTTDGMTSADTGSSESGGFIPTPDMGGGGPQPNGAMCMTNDECESMFCYQVPMLGGVCSECLTDMDCRTGTCGIDFAAMYAICMPGAMGDMCDTDEGCMGDLVCADVIDTGGIFPASFCSECSETTPCPDGQTCSPSYDVANFGGYMSCVDPGSVPNDQGCPLDAADGGDGVCMSGHCGAVDVMGFIMLGVCGDCETDMDCMAMETCMPGMADMMGLVGSTCG